MVVHFVDKRLDVKKTWAPSIWTLHTQPSINLSLQAGYKRLTRCCWLKVPRGVLLSHPLNQLLERRGRLAGRWCWPLGLQRWWLCWCCRHDRGRRTGTACGTLYVKLHTFTTAEMHGLYAIVAIGPGQGFLHGQADDNGQRSPRSGWIHCTINECRYLKRFCGGVRASLALCTSAQYERNSEL